MPGMVEITCQDEKYNSIDGNFTPVIFKTAFTSLSSKTDRSLILWNLQLKSSLK